MLLPKLGEVSCRFGRLPKGRILSATVKREADGTYAVTVMSEEPRPEQMAKTGKNTGIDLGIRTLAVTSEGTEYKNPKTYDRNLKKLIRAQRKLSRKTKDSRNGEKQRILVAKIHVKIRNQRQDAIHKMTHELVKENDVICMEDLDVKELLRSMYGGENKRITDDDYDKSLAVRCRRCPVCKEMHDRDINAAKNILNEGLKKISS